MASTTYYTEQRLETELGYNANTAAQWQATSYIPPLSFLESVHMPNAIGSLTTIPGGPYATSVDVSHSAMGPTPLQSATMATTRTKVIAVAAILAAFYIFLPQRA